MQPVERQLQSILGLARAESFSEMTVLRPVHGLYRCADKIVKLRPLVFGPSPQKIPILRCVLWALRRRFLRGNARHWKGAVPVDPTSEVHGSRNRQETSNRPDEECIILESQQ
jgi:hypothetical protein